MGVTVDPDTVVTPPATAAPLGRIAVGGFVWSFGLSVVAKAGTLVGQVALARLLVPDDYAVVSLAAAMAVVPNVLRDGGVTSVLVQRQDGFGELANAAFWLSATLGLVAAVLIAGVAPAAAHVYGNALLTPLMLVLAATALVNALTVVPQAKTQVDLRLRLGAVLASGGQIATTLASVLLAYFGYGPYALVAPLLIVAVLRAAVLWPLSPTQLRWRPDFARWRVFFVDGGLLMGTALFWSVTMQGDYAVLGYSHDKAALGYYVFAFGLSMQTVQLLGVTLAGVMFPTLSRLKNEAVRQRDAMIDASRLSGIVMVPVALFPALCPAEIIRLFFGDRWLPAATLLQLLSVAAAVASLGLPMGSYLMAQGRNRTVFGFSVVMSGVFVALVVLGTRLAGANGTAVAVGVFQLVQTVIGFRLVLGPGGPVWRAVWQIVGVPVLLSAGAAVAAGLLTHRTPVGRLPDLATITVAFVLMSGLYAGLVYVFARDVATRLAVRARSVVAR